MIEENRPSSVVALAILAIVLGLVSLLASAIGITALLGLGFYLGASDGLVSSTQTWGIVSFAAEALGSLLYLAFGIAVLASRRSAWWFGVLGAVAMLVSSAVVIAIGAVGEFASVLLSLGFACALVYFLCFQPAVKSYFGRP